MASYSVAQIFTCGYCGSGITAEEKVKELKTGETRGYVYYRCTGIKDRECPNEPINEPTLIEEMLTIIDDMSLEKSELKQKLEKEVTRYALFQTGVLKKDLPQSQKNRDISIKTFAKYLLQHGILMEKREVLSCIKSRIFVKDKKLSLIETEQSQISDIL